MILWDQNVLLYVSGLGQMNFELCFSVVIELSLFLGFWVLLWLWSECDFSKTSKCMQIWIVFGLAPFSAISKHRTGLKIIPFWQEKQETKCVRQTLSIHILHWFRNLFFFPAVALFLGNKTKLKWKMFFLFSRIKKRPSYWKSVEMTLLVFKTLMRK